MTASGTGSGLCDAFTVEQVHIPHRIKAAKGSRISRAAILPALTVLLLWLVFLADHGLDLDLHTWGILPRVASGLPGILFSPFLHGDAGHLFNNSVPLFVLGWALLYFYPRVAGQVVLASWLVSGLWVWISARSSYHIGASGVVYGLAAFLFVSGLLRRQRTLMALSLLIVFLYGSMVWGIFPLVDHISWESHLWGGVAGVLMAYRYRKVPPAVQDPPPPVFDDEEEEETAAQNATRPARPTAPLRIVYHLDPGDGVSDEEPDGRSKRSGQGQSFDPDRTSGTWPPERQD